MKPTGIYDWLDEIPEKYHLQLIKLYINLVRCGIERESAANMLVKIYRKDNWPPDWLGW